MVWNYFEKLMQSNFGWDCLKCFYKILWSDLGICGYNLNLLWHKYIKEQYMEIYNIENYKCSDTDWVSKERSMLLT